MKLKGKVAFITGGSRGIGREIALAFAREGANVAVAAKTDDPHPKLPGTIHTVADEVEKLGVKCLPMKVDVREEENVAQAMDATRKTFGRLDILVNNAGAISLTPLEHTPMKKVDLMLQINVRAVLLCAKYAIPLLKEAGGGHILSLSPPISMDPKWFRSFVPYTISKFGMTMATVGLSGELADAGIAVNSLWPRTTIWTAAVNMLQGEEGRDSARTPAIMADAALEIVASDPRKLTGRQLIDEDFLRERGVKDFEKYAMKPGAELMPDLYV
ncbi:MAG: NAD(P)-dependent oxidoreductase, partial [Candidatus Methylomirabilis sp.]|nr:NAD(P)-dependent oxidoreductase [Deltaproteobacteria bacterium]